MAPGLDCAVSSLLCAEETESIYFDESLEEFETTHHHKTSKNQNFVAKEVIMNSFPLQRDEVLDLMFKKECEHLPASDYLERLRNGGLDLKARQEAVHWIEKVCVYIMIDTLIY